MKKIVIVAGILKDMLDSLNVLKFFFLKAKFRSFQEQSG